MAFEENDRPLDGAIRETLIREDVASDACPSPDVFAAYYEHSLDPEETARYDRHFATCKSCRQILAGVARANADTSQLAAAGEKSSAWAWLKNTSWLVPATAVAAVVAVILTVELYPRHNAMRGPTPQVAQLEKADKVEQTEPSEKAETPDKTETAEKPEQPSSPSSSISVTGANPLPLPSTRAPNPAPQSAAAQIAPQPAPPKPEAPQITESSNVAVMPAIAGAAVNAPKPSSSSGAHAATAARSGSGNGVGQFARRKDEAKMAAAAQAVAQSAAQADQSAVISPPAASESVTVEASPEVIQNANIDSGRVVVPSPDTSVVWTVFSGGRVDFAGNSPTSAVHDFLPTTHRIAAGSSPGGKICWLVGASGTVLRTTTGRIWVVVPPPVNADFTAVDASSATAATITAADGRKFSTANAGQSWQALK